MNTLPAVTPPIAVSHPLETLPAKVHHLAHLVNAVTNLLSSTLSIVSLLHQLSPHTKSSHIIETRVDHYHTAFLFSRKSLVNLVDFVSTQADRLPIDADTLLSNEGGQAMVEDAVVSLKAAAEICELLPALIEALDQAQNGLAAPRKGVMWNGWPFTEAWEELQRLNERLVMLREEGEGENGVGWRQAWYHLVDV